jgi:hypothetical protein
MEIIPAMMMQMRICEKYHARKPITQIIRMMKKSLYFWYKVVMLKMLFIVTDVDNFGLRNQFSSLKYKDINVLSNPINL